MQLVSTDNYPAHHALSARLLNLCPSALVTYTLCRCRDMDLDQLLKQRTLQPLEVYHTLSWMGKFCPRCLGLLFVLHRFKP